MKMLMLVPSVPVVSAALLRMRINRFVAEFVAQYQKLKVQGCPLGGVGAAATTDVDGTFEQVQASGAEVAQEPIDQPYGVRDCAFRDPAGNMVRIQEPR